ncbi:MAG: transglutaminase family protein [Methylobacterium mesophilicum]|nr:transglutaminase family protein [Methylobacterium mesophilicum]
MTVFSVRHVTEYRYRRPVGFGEHRIMFRPRDSFDQRLIDAQLRVTPEPVSTQWIHDVFGNCVALLRFDEKAETLRFETRMRVEHASSGIPEFRIRDQVLRYPFQYDGEELPDLAPTIVRLFGQPGDEVDRWARRFLSGRQETATGKLLMTMCYAIRESFNYARRTEPGIQTPAETLSLGRGTCRDFALLMMEAVRALGLAARFVSGYIYVPSRDGSDTRGGGSTHAWTQVYLPGAGWVEFDPTNGIVGNRDLIRVAVARDPAQAIPLSGSYYGAAGDDLGIDVQVNVTTEQNHEDGREKPSGSGNEASVEGFTERSRARDPVRSTFSPSPLREASRT